jgi:hypothetical protein
MARERPGNGQGKARERPGKGQGKAMEQLLFAGKSHTMRLQAFYRLPCTLTFLYLPPLKTAKKAL